MMFWLLAVTWIITQIAFVNTCHCCQNHSIGSNQTCCIHQNSSDEINIECPITTMPIVIPFRSKYANGKIVYEKKAIMQYLLRNGGTAKCPLTNENITKDSFFVDQTLRKKIAKQGKSNNHSLFLNAMNYVFFCYLKFVFNGR